MSPAKQPLPRGQTTALLHRWLPTIMVAAMGAALFLPQLGERRFWYSYEARVAQVARQMLRATNIEGWLLPRLGNQERLKKPPLAYWLAALASWLFGEVNHLTARLPNACAGILCLLLIYDWGRRLHSQGAGLTAAIALGTSGLFWQHARSAGLETPLLLFNVMALYSWWRSCHASEDGAAPNPVWLLVTYASLGLSFLQKGPVGPVLVALIILAYLALSGAWRSPGAGWRWHLAGLALFMVLALPWYAAVIYYKPEACAIWLRESAGRIEGFDHLRHPNAYFLWQLLGNGQPWLLPAIFAIALFWRGAVNRQALLFTWVWALVTLLFFSIPGSKKNYYLLPIYPALALQAGIAFAAAASDIAAWPAIWLRRLLLASGIALALGAAGVFCAVPLLAERGRFSAIYASPPQLSLAAAVFLASGISLFVCGWRRHFFGAVGVLAVAMAALFAIYLSLIPAFDREKSQEIYAQALQPYLKSADEVFTYYQFAPEELMWYLDRPVRMLANPGEVKEAATAARGGIFYILADERDLRHFPEEIRASLRPLPNVSSPKRLRWWFLPEQQK